MVFLIILVYLVFISQNSFASKVILANSAQVQITVFSATSLVPYINPSALNSTKGTIRSIPTTKSHLYILNTDGAVQIYSKETPSFCE